MATTMRFGIDVDDHGSVAFAKFAASVEGASGAVDKNSAALKTQAKTAEVSTRATLSMVKADKLLADAERVLSGEAEETARQLRQQGRAAEESAAKTKLAGDAAKGASAGFGGLGPGLGAVIGAGVALAPIAVTLGLGLGGLGLAALQTAKRTDEMAKVFGPLKAEIKDFQTSLQPQVLTLFSDGAGIAKDALHQLQPVAAATGTALHGVLGQVGAEFKSGQWQQFFKFMAASAGPDLQLVGNVLVDLAKDLPPLLEQLQPAGRLVLILADDTLKVVGALGKFHLLLPVVGAAIGFMVGGPIGALVGGLAGVAIQAAATNTEITKTGQAIRQLGELKPVTRQMVDFAGVAGAVAANMSSSAVAVTDVQNAMIDLHPKLGTVRGDMDLLNISITSGNVVLKAYSDLWDHFVGNSVSDQQAVLNLAQAFDSYNSTVKASGRTSTAARQSFLSVFDAVGTGLETLHKNGASVQQLNSFYQTSIDRLNALHGLTPAQRGDIAGLTKDYIAWANATHGLSGQVVTAAGALRDTFLAQVANGRRLVPQASADITALADAVLKTGQRSSATAADRAVLIADLRRSGLTAQAAASLVTDFQRQVDALHGKTVDVNLATSGSGTIVITGTGINQRTINTSTGVLRGPGGHTLAAGGRVPGFGGGDIWPALLEPGEAVVDKFTTARHAGTLKAMGVPGFAAGGVVGKVAGAEAGIGTAEAQWAQFAAVAFAQAAIKAQQTALSGFLGAGSGNYAADIATVLSAMGLPLSLVPNWLRQIQTESGGSLTAVNLTDSNAAAGHPSVGLLQLIPSTFHAYAGPYSNTPPLVNFGGGTVSENPMAQIYAGIHYAAARYGGAAMASVIGQGHGYDSGGYLPPGLSLAYNGTGRPEPVIPAGRLGGNTYNITVNVPVGAHPAQAGKEVVSAIREYERVNGNGWRS